MINLKLSGIAAAAGFILSFLVGAASGGGLPFSLLRALICGAVFFGLASGIWVMINRFLPELLPSASVTGEDPLPPEEEAGSHVDISVDDGDDAFDDTIPAGAVAPDEGGAENDLGNISDLVAKEGMDQNNKESYTNGGNDLLSAQVEAAGFVPAPLPMSRPGVKAGLEPLPGLDAMAGAFMPSEDAGEEDGAAVASPAEGKQPGTKGQSTGEGADSKKMASAIQTILKKD